MVSKLTDVLNRLSHNLAVLGEAAKALSPELRARFPEVPWRNVIAQRNVVVHGYHSLNVNSLWTTARQDIPDLDRQIAAMQGIERGPRPFSPDT
jgi:uncharacterized protein with HEPN domain